MPADRTTPGPRFTKPTVNAADIRDGSFHREDFAQMMRAAAVSDRLGLDDLAHTPLPASLRELRYICDQDDLSAFGGMPLFMQYCYGLGLADWLAAVPVPEGRSDVRYSAGKKCEVIIAGFVAGLERVAHFDDVKDDPGLCAAVGLERLPDQSTFSRFFAAANAATVAHLEATNQRFAGSTMATLKRPSRLMVDIDTRDMAVYGKQEGTVASPRKDGNGIYTFEIVTLRNSRDMLLGDLMAGATHPAPLFRQRFEAVLGQLAPRTDELHFSADAAWAADYVLRMIEAADADRQVPCRCTYTVRAQMSERLRHKIAALPEDAWVRYDEVHEVAELTHRFTETRDEHGGRVREGHPERRYVVTRKRLKDIDGEQQALLEAPRYSYDAIVTNLDWNRKRVLRTYNGRATVESVLKESALGFNMDSLPSGCFDGNRVFCQLLVLAYNLVNLFRRLCMPTDDKRGHLPGLRRRLLAVPGRIGGSEGGCVVRCSSNGTLGDLMAYVVEQIRMWLAPVGVQPVLAGAG